MFEKLSCSSIICYWDIGGRRNYLNWLNCGVGFHVNLVVYQRKPTVFLEGMCSGICSRIPVVSQSTSLEY